MEVEFSAVVIRFDRKQTGNVQGLARKPDGFYIRNHQVSLQILYI
jgi:hypothetical protein